MPFTPFQPNPYAVPHATPNPDVRDLIEFFGHGYCHIQLFDLPDPDLARFRDGLQGCLNVIGRIQNQRAHDPGHDEHRTHLGAV